MRSAFGKMLPRLQCYLMAYPEFRGKVTWGQAEDLRGLVWSNECPPKKSSPIFLPVKTSLSLFEIMEVILEFLNMQMG